MTFPDDLQYTNHHEWMRLEGENACVGITDHLQVTLGPLIEAKLPDIGSQLRCGDIAATLQSTLSSHNLAAPVSGTVMAVNVSLHANPSLINADPYGNGWLFKLRIEAGEEIEHLQSASSYQAQLLAAESQDFESP